MPKRPPPALLDYRGLDLLEDGGEVAHLGREVDPERPRIAHEGRGEVGLDEDAAIGEQLAEEGLGLAVVGAEEGGVLAVLLDPLGGPFP